MNNYTKCYCIPLMQHKLPKYERHQTDPIDRYRARVCMSLDVCNHNMGDEVDMRNRLMWAVRHHEILKLQIGEV
jgi:hypothetical protein